MLNFLRVFTFRVQCTVLKYTLFVMIYYGISFRNAAESAEAAVRTAFRIDPRPEDPVAFSEFVKWMLRSPLMSICQALRKSGDWWLKMHRISCEVFSQRMPDHTAVIFKDLPAPEPHQKA